MYTELHLHTAYSFLDGASLPEDYIAAASRLGYTSLAITDHDGLHGAMEFAQAATAAGIHPITGAEITLADGSHLTLIAENRPGYANLCRLLTAIHHDRPPLPVLLDDDADDLPGDDLILSHLPDYAEGLILLTGCRKGQLARFVDAGELAAARQVLQQYIQWFGPANVFVELQQNHVFGDTARIERLVHLAEACGVRYVATGNAHYHHRDRSRLQDVLVSIKHHTTLDGSHRERRANSEFYLHSPEEMEAIFSDYPEAIRSTELIAERCAGFTIADPKKLGYAFPDFPIETGESVNEHLTRICWQEFAAKYPNEGPDSPAWERLSQELGIIVELKLSGFFLIYRELLTLSHDIAAELRGSNRTGSRSFLPPGRGRGSAVSSIVCYLIGLSPIDPIKHKLYLGRFLNTDLKSVPDIDIDFPREIREKMIERVYEVFGHDHVALVCAFSTYRLRSAVRDVGKALGIPPADLDRISRLSEPGRASSIEDALSHLPEYGARKHAPPWSHLIDISRQLVHFPRHVTQHVGGMIISVEPLNEIVPIQPATMDGRFICQWDKDSCDDARFIKIDFLALGMLSLVEECLDQIDKLGGEPVDLSRINFSDPKVFRMIQAGDTIGTFQIESRAQIQMIRQTKPANLQDLIVQVAIVRPGPIIGGAVAPFVERRLDPDFTPTFDHPSLQEALTETLGVVLYQEQVVQVAEILAGFTPGQADQLRRAMTRKRSTEAIAAMKEEFIQGCLTAKHDPPVTIEVAEKVYGKLEGFAEYGFPKSHATAFALLAYQSCWLKQNYPTEFLCALLNNQPMGFYPPHVLINDGKRAGGLKVLRPDINLSELDCTVEGPKIIRIGFSYVKGLTEDDAERLLDNRVQQGPFHSLADLIRRVPLRTDTLENLIAAGALDDFGLQRREMLWQIGLFIRPTRFGSRTNDAKPRGRQLPLPLSIAQDYVELPPTTAWERTLDSYRVLDMSLQYHPIQLLRSRFPKHMVSTRDLPSLPDGYRIQIPGLVVCRQRPGTAKGITFLLLEDEYDVINVIVYPDLYKKQRLEVRSTPLLAVEGKLQLRNNNVNIIAERLLSLEGMGTKMPAHNGWDVPSTDDVDLDRIQLMRAPVISGPQDHDDPLSIADIRAVSPISHNYR